MYLQPTTIALSAEGSRIGLESPFVQTGVERNLFVWFDSPRTGSKLPRHWQFHHSSKHWPISMACFLSAAAALLPGAWSSPAHRPVLSAACGPHPGQVFHQRRPQKLICTRSPCVSVWQMKNRSDQQPQGFAFLATPLIKTEQRNFCSTTRTRIPYSWKRILS